MLDIVVTLYLVKDHNRALIGIKSVGMNEIFVLCGQGINENILFVLRTPSSLSQQCVAY